MRVTCRQIAKVLVRSLPLNDDEVAGKVDEYTKAIEAMPEKARNALKSAYIFSSKVSPEEREDFFQELVLQVLEAFNHQKVTGIKRVNEVFAYTAGKFRLWNWKKKRKRRQPYFGGSLNEVTTDEEGNEVELINTLVGEAHFTELREANFEDEVIAKLEAQRIWDSLPEAIKPIIIKKLRGEPLLVSEQSRLERFRKKLNLG